MRTVLYKKREQSKITKLFIIAIIYWRELIIMIKLQACPFSMNRPELCKAALSSLMIDEKCCQSETYEICAIYLIVSKQITGLTELDIPISPGGG